MSETIDPVNWSPEKAGNPAYTAPTGCPAEYPDACPTPGNCPVHGEVDCDHDTVIEQERVDGILFGLCAGCNLPVAQTGLEDEDGVPGWEVAQ